MHARRAERRRAPVEWPTVLVAGVIYGGWLAMTWYHQLLPWWVLLPAGAWVCAWQSSLQHEIIHGHPTRWRAVNRALGLPTTLLFLPYDRYRALHLAHHRNDHLTDPLEDPETFYWTGRDWDRLGPLGRGAVEASSCLIGRLVIGPVWAVSLFLWREAARLRADEPGVRAAWAAHLPPLAASMAWIVGVCGMSPALYVAAFILPAVALLQLRSFAEHRAAADPLRRSAVVETRGPLGLLFLNNNLHAAHHDRPSLAWYRLPGFYAAERGRLLAANGGLVYRGYAGVARRYLFQAHDRPVHPDHPG